MTDDDRRPCICGWGDRRLAELADLRRVLAESLLPRTGGQGLGQELAEHVAAGALFYGCQLVDLGERFGAEADGYVVSGHGFSVAQRCTVAHERATVSHMTTTWNLNRRTGSTNWTKAISRDSLETIYARSTDEYTRREVMAELDRRDDQEAEVA